MSKQPGLEMWEGTTYHASPIGATAKRVAVGETAHQEFRWSNCLLWSGLEGARGVITLTSISTL